MVTTAVPIRRAATTGVAAPDQPGCWLRHPGIPGAGGNSQFRVQEGKGQVPQEKKQKTATTRRDSDEAGVEPRDQRDKELDDDTSAVLDDIACCLAEVQEDNRAARQAAKDEWDENFRKFSAREIPFVEFNYNRESWVLKYRHMFEIGVDCCGGAPVPDFSGLE